jgi:adenylate cyclase class IV
VVPDPAELRQRLLANGARPGFAGLMLDRRFDHAGELLARDEVLRVRLFRQADGNETAWLGWKGPTGTTPEGYKSRRELEFAVQGDGASPAELLEALDFQESLRIDRYVEYYELGDTSLRLEWYPRMDVLLEVEGSGAGIERALRVTGLPRSEFSADSLTAFATRFEVRTGLPALLSLDPASPVTPSWESR